MPSTLCSLSSPFYEWRTSFPIEALEARLNQGGWRVGTIATLTPFEYSQAGRVVRIRILHSLGELLLRGEDLRRVVGYRVIPSTRFTVEAVLEDAVNVWSKELPYLKGVDCPFDRDSPFYEWRTSFPIEALEARLNQGGWRVGTIATLTPFEYSQAGRVVRIRILHSLGELLLRGEDLRRVVGYRVIPSTRFTVEALGREVALSGYGNGHAVGMCQWGTKELAELGYPFRAILQYYYPGTEISRSWRLDPVVRLAP